jgi:phosphate uptake regulator
MLELQKNLEKLTLRLERMGLRVAEAVNNAFDAIAQRDVTAGEWIDEDDSQID